MSSTEILFRLIGSVSLLLWGLRMVRTGISRGFGGEMRQVIQKNTTHRVKAFGAGIFVTMLVQSSTATALITASFARQGYITLVAGLAVILGADVGTTLVAQFLSLDLSLLPFLLLSVGFILHKTANRARYRQLGRAGIGLGLMLFALGLIVQTAEPLGQSQVFRDVLLSLASEPILAVLVAAILAWITHSSLATVLLIASLVSTGTLPVSLGILLILGANLGGSIAPVLATLSSGILARRVTIGNAALKFIGVVICLPFVGLIADQFARLGIADIRVALNFHMAFNFALALVFLPLVSQIAALLERFVKDTDEQETAPIQFLDPSLYDTPVLALGSASREVIGMAGHVETMLRGTMVAMQENDLEMVDSLTKLDDTIDELYEEIKLYVTQVTKQEMNSAETMRAAEILLFTTNLEHIGDIVENVLVLTHRKISEKLMFSDDGFAEIEELHGRVSTNLTLATSVFMSGDVAAARKLLEEKTEISKLQNTLTHNHLERLREGQPETIATSALHLDILRDLRRVHSHITAVAYPVLEAAGALRKSRLRKDRS